MEQELFNESHFNILIVDDIRDIHPITKNAFFDEKVYGKPIYFISAFDEDEAKNTLAKYHNYISIILLDITMKNKDGGLEVIKFVRNELDNKLIQIIIRTAESSSFPMRKIIDDFNIHDYIEKGETADDQLYVSIKSAVRTFVALKANMDSIDNLERQVAERTIELRQLFNVSTPLIQINSQHQIINVNNSFKKLFKRSDELINKTCYEILECSKKGQKNCSLVKMLNGRSTTIYESSKILDDDTIIHYRVNAIPIKDEDGNITSVVENIVDITQIKEQKVELENHKNNLECQVQERTDALIETKEDLEQANKQLLVLDEAKTEFLRIISHEINTPLGGVVGSAELLKHTVTDLLDGLYESADRLRSISTTALNFTHMQAHGRDMKKSSVNIKSIIEEVIKSNKPNAEKKRLVFKTILCKIEYLHCVSDYFKQSIEELISNAVKFSHINTIIEIRTVCEEDKLKIVISDEGEIIKPEKIDKIIEPFGLAQEHYDKHIGLGLCYVRTFLDIHEASFEISSNSTKTEFSLIFNKIDDDLL